MSDDIFSTHGFTTDDPYPGTTARPSDNTPYTFYTYAYSPAANTSNGPPLVRELHEEAHHQFPGNQSHAEKHPKESCRSPAARGECKFDGTDFPDWLPLNPFKRADEPFTFPFPEVSNPWEKQPIPP
ncbi:hypothetical protein CVT24_002269 [Panaeolus cyanescens]|uniref:Uncharacterized protein n=1 Tax=Panaeolus cyanescens TaxID=181874 RepID=A0A409YIA3_9AGAR|nr:hypothetical protein CVT24_002269 [Panaeolus cyanescens]